MKVTSAALKSLQPSVGLQQSVAGQYTCGRRGRIAPAHELPTVLLLHICDPQHVEAAQNIMLHRWRSTCVPACSMSVRLDCSPVLVGLQPCPVQPSCTVSDHVDKAPKVTRVSPSYSCFQHLTKDLKLHVYHLHTAAFNTSQRASHILLPYVHYTLLGLASCTPPPPPVPTRSSLQCWYHPVQQQTCPTATLTCISVCRVCHPGAPQKQSL